MKLRKALVAAMGIAVASGRGNPEGLSTRSVADTAPSTCERTDPVGDASIRDSAFEVAPYQDVARRPSLGWTVASSSKWTWPLPYPAVRSSAGACICWTGPFVSTLIRRPPRGDSRGHPGITSTAPNTSFSSYGTEQGSVAS